MSPTLFREEETRQWIAYAREDLGIAETLIPLPAPPVRGALFHCQQAAEKVMKGFLAWHQRPVPKMHDLRLLGRQCIAVDASLEVAVKPAFDLTQFAVRFRYPGEPDVPTVEEAKAVLEVARALFAAICNRLPEQVRGTG